MLDSKVIKPYCKRGSSVSSSSIAIGSSKKSATKNWTQKRFPSTHIVVHLLDGGHLLGCDLSTGKSDPVAWVWCGYNECEPVWGSYGRDDSCILLSKTCRNTIDPIWNEELIFPLQVTDVESITSLRCVILVRDERLDADGGYSYRDLGIAEILMSEIVEQGKVFKSSIVDNARRYELQKTPSMRRVDGCVKVTVSVHFAEDGVKHLFRGGVDTVDKFATYLQRSVKEGNLDGAEGSLMAAFDTFPSYGRRKPPRKTQSPIISRQQFNLKESLFEAIEAIEDSMNRTVTLEDFDDSVSTSGDFATPPRHQLKYMDSPDGQSEMGCDVERGGAGLGGGGDDDEDDDDNDRGPLRRKVSMSFPARGSESMGGGKGMRCLTACCSTFLGLCFLGLLLAGPLSSTTMFSTVYVIKPSNCTDESLFVNASRWYLNPWYLILSAGACPTDADHAFYFYEGHIKSQVNYENCIKFSDEDQWLKLDVDNRDHGYETNFAAGADVWLHAYYHAVLATLLLYSIYPVMALSMKYRSNSSWLIYIAPAVVPTGFALMFMALVYIEGTSQLDPVAWSSSYFQSCHVAIEASAGYELGASALFLSGTFLLVLYALLLALCLSSTCANAATGRSGDGDADALGDDKGFEFGPRQGPATSRSTSSLFGDVANLVAGGVALNSSRDAFAHTSASVGVGAGGTVSGAKGEEGRGASESEPLLDRRATTRGKADLSTLRPLGANSR